MALPFDKADLDKLKKFFELASANPKCLNLPMLSFVKDFIEQFGGTVPAGDFEMPAGAGKCPFGGDTKTAPPQPEEPSEDEESAESEVELDMEGVIEPDTDVNQPMGDSSKTASEEDIDKSSELRSQAAAAYGEQKFQEAIDLYTQAIELNPGNALFHAKRGQAFLKLKKPNACIRDCDKALEINCDSAAAYKFRGRANRLLGRWEDAAKDLRQACKLDYDEETDEWLREVTPNAKKLEQHRLKQQRKQADRARKAAEKRRNQARQTTSQQQSASAGPSFPSSSADFADPFQAFCSGADRNKLLECMQDPEVKGAVMDILQNPANINKYKSNPKIQKVIEFISKVMPVPPTAPQPEEAPKKPDFVDDGLD